MRTKMTHNTDCLPLATRLEPLYHVSCTETLLYNIVVNFNKNEFISELIFLIY